MRSRWWSGPLADAAAALLLTSVMLAATMTSPDYPARPVDAAVVIAVIAIAAWTAAARRAPRTALAGATVTFFIALAIGIPAFSPALALGVPLFAVALAGHLPWAAVVVGGIGLSGLLYRTMGEGAEPFLQVAVGTLFDLTLLTVIVLLGETIRSRRSVREEAALRLRLAQQEHQQRITDERLRTARDLHDVLAHTVTVVRIQASVAAENIDERPDRAREAIESVRAASQDALSDLHSTIAVLRADDPETEGPAPAPGLDQLPELVDAARGAGMVASLHVGGDTGRVRATVALAIYRVVQESLTNALRHSGARSLAVAVDCEHDEVRVTVRDDGRGAANRPGSGQPTGSGLRGMTERVAALGGTLSYGAADDGEPGWVVRARVPASGTSSG